MKIDQIAFYASTDEQAAKIKEQFGLLNAEWIKDTVTATSVVWGNKHTNIAELQFNYDLGIELEILRYINGPHWRDPDNLVHSMGFIESFISHVGIHLADGEDFPTMMHCRLVQETWTQGHTAKYLTDPSSPAAGRKYHYRIFEMSQGSYIKYIRRIHPKV